MTLCGQRYPCDSRSQVNPRSQLATFKYGTSARVLHLVLAVRRYPQDRSPRGESALLSAIPCSLVTAPLTEPCTGALCRLQKRLTTCRMRDKASIRLITLVESVPCRATVIGSSRVRPFCEMEKTFNGQIYSNTCAIDCNEKWICECKTEI